MKLHFFAYCLATLLGAAVPAIADICTSPNNTFHVVVNLNAGELGYFTFKECGDTISPTIGLEVGETYTFIQAYRTNYYHPMGFGYGPDGAHKGNPELEPTVSMGTSSCDKNATCPAPMYFIGGQYQGQYSNIPEVKNITTNVEDFGLDVYEPTFKHPVAQWTRVGPFEIKLSFDDTTYTNDIYYFCHVHHSMTGRIKLLSGGVPVNETDGSDLGYVYVEPSEYDKSCGTYNLNDFQLPNEQCPSRFVCGTENLSPNMQAYAHCTDAMNCHMLTGMTAGVNARSEEALFIHEMVPHHRNAVNMAKLLLKRGNLVCDDLSNEEDMDCVLMTVLYDIVNTQNFQIQQMLAYLDYKNIPEEDDCVVKIASSSEGVVSGSNSHEAMPLSLMLVSTAMLMASMVM